MRKSLLIIFGLICCLFFAGGGELCAARTVIPDVQVSIDRASDDEWRCEREYNSDLSLPRVCGETTAQAGPVLVRSLIPDAGRTSAARLAALCYAATAPRESSCQKTFDPVAGPCAVDYYVFRLRRLII